MRHSAKKRQRIGCPRPMTLRAGLMTPRKAFSMRGKIDFGEGTIGASPSPRVAFMLARRI